VDNGNGAGPGGGEGVGVSEAAVIDALMARVQQMTVEAVMKDAAIATLRAELSASREARDDALSDSSPV